MITGGFKNMDADQIIKCILAVMIKLEKSTNSVVEDSIVDGVVDKAPSQNIVYDAISNLLEIISNLASNDIGNNSPVPGETVTDALNNLYSFSGVLEFIDYPRLLSNQQTFTIPAGKTAKFAMVNYGTNYLPETANNTGEINTFTQTDNIVTFNETLVIGNYLVIFY